MQTVTPESSLQRAYYRARYYDSQVGRFVGEDAFRFSDGSNFFAYTTNSPVTSVDPLGYYALTLKIAEHPKNFIETLDQLCDRHPGGACTLINTVYVSCNCLFCPDSGWTADDELRVYGDLFYYTGPWNLMKRTPADKSVVDGPTAIAHEYRVHINPALTAVKPLIAAMEAKSYQTPEECRDDCANVSKLVHSTFMNVLKMTQQKEAGK